MRARWGSRARLLPFLPLPVVGKEGERYRWLAEEDLPQSIGRLSAFMGNAGVLLRAYIYMRLLGREGMRAGGRVRHAQRQLPAGAADDRPASTPPIPQRRASHEFIVTLKRQARELGVTAMDFAKRLLDHGFHAPDHLLPAAGAGVPADRADRDREQGRRWTHSWRPWSQIQKEAEQEPERVTSAPHTMPVRRLDDVRAARQLDLTWKPTAQP